MTAFYASKFEAKGMSPLSSPEEQSRISWPENKQWDKALCYEAFSVMADCGFPSVRPRRRGKQVARTVSARLRPGAHLS